MSETSPTQKRCSKCGETKPLDTFSKCKREKDGRQTYCKMCMAQYKAANAEVIDEQNRAYRAANADVMCEYNRAYRVANPDYKRNYRAANAEAIRNYNRAYRAANASSINEKRRTQYATNPQAIRDYKSSYRAAHPDVHRADSQRRRVRIKGNGGNVTAQELSAMRAAQNGVCAYCCYQYDPDYLTIDHIIPITRGGKHEIGNICFACPRCNFSKQNKLLSEWVNRWYEQKK